MESMIRLKEQGKIRDSAYAISAKDLTELLKITPIETNQMAYNLL